MEETIGVKTDEIIQESNDTNKPNATFEEMYKKLFGKEPYGGKRPADPPKEDQYRINENDLNDNISVFEDMEEYKKTTYKFIGIAFKTYIILEMNQELYIMDQHAAHERILYEKIKANFYTEGPKDRVDETIMDLKGYTHSLVVEEMNLGNLIENAVKQMAEQEAKEEDEDAEEEISMEELEALKDEDFMTYNDFIEEEEEADAEMLKMLEDG